MEKADFDCVLMDIEMPVMYGLTCVKAIRQHESSCSVVLIANDMVGFIVNH